MYTILTSVVFSHTLHTQSVLMAFSSHARIWGAKVQQIIPHLHFFFFFFLVEIAYVYQFHSLGQAQSTVAQEAEMTAQAYPDKLHVNLFPSYS